MDLRGDVQQFLTGMRARLTPEQAGVTMFGGERRVPGLRREEVARLAGVSTAYYTRLERGNLRGVSDSVLHSLARILHMNEAESQHLFDLARAASGGARTSRMKPPSGLPQRAAQLIDAMPDVPTVALSRLGDLVGANALGRALYQTDPPSRRRRPHRRLRDPRPRLSARRPHRHLPHRPGHSVGRRARPAPQLGRDHGDGCDSSRLVRALETP
jgi:transcriptional regulator with XRE-family HTH domain